MHRFLMELVTTQHTVVAIFRMEFYGNRTEIQKAGQCYSYARKESMYFITPIFKELRSAQPHYEEIFDTKFNPKRSRNIEGMG